MLVKLDSIVEVISDATFFLGSSFTKKLASKTKLSKYRSLPFKSSLQNLTLTYIMISKKYCYSSFMVNYEY